MHEPSVNRPSPLGRSPKQASWFNARNITIFLVALFILSVTWAVIAQWIPPNPRRPAFDSYSGTVIGYRAVHDLLAALDVPVQRSTTPPPALFGPDRRILLLRPSLLAIELEKDYLEDLHAWLHDGGELVLVSDDLDKDALRGGFPGEGRSRERMLEFFGEDRLLDSLDIGDLTVTYEGRPRAYFDRDREDWRHIITNELAAYRRSDRQYRVVAEGTLSYLAQLIDTLHLPGRSLRTFEGASIDDAIGMLSVAPEGSQGELAPIALEFAVGDGTALVIAEPALFTNASLARGENAVAIYHLAAGRAGRPVWIDEYYHGSLSRSSALQVLTFHPFPIIAAAVLLAALVWVWGNLVRFGPPLEYRPPSRRNILEYVDAMARLYKKGRKHAFVLKTLRDGTLDRLRQELGLSPGLPQDVIMGRLRQRNGAAAKELQVVLDEIDALISSGAGIAPGAVTRLQGNLQQCRWKNSPHPAHPPLPAPPQTPAAP
jgi:hypothetical protein